MTLGLNRNLNNQISSPGAPKKQDSQNWLAALQKIELMESPTWVWGDLDKGNSSWYFDRPSFSQDTDAVGRPATGSCLFSWHLGRWDGEDGKADERVPMWAIDGQWALLKFLQTGISLVVHWLRLQAPKAGDLGSIPDQGIRSHMPQIRVCKPH